MNFSLLFANDIKIFFPEVFLTCSILVLLIYGVLVATSLNYNYPLISPNIYLFTSFILVLTLLLCFNTPVDCALLFQRTFLHDDLVYISKIFVLVSALIMLILTFSYIQKDSINNFEYFVLILFSVLGLNLLVSSFDLLSVYLSIELQALSFYVLAAFQRRSVFSTESGLKYFILGSLSSGLLLYSFSLIYGITGSTNLADIKSFSLDVFFEGSSVLDIALVFLIAGFLFKIAAFPFHMWSPDVYEGAPTSTTVFFALVPKIAVLVFFTRILFFSFPCFVYLWEKVLLFSALGSIIYAAFVALKQDSLKRLLAYSAIGHVGFILLPFSTNSIDGMQALFFYALIYIITSIPTWGVVVSCFKASKNSQNNINVLAGLLNTSPFLAFIGALSFFSLAGIPPLVGFLSKVFVFFSAIKSSLYLIAVLILVISVISTFYYINVIKTIFFEKRKGWVLYHDISKEMALILALSSFLLLVFFFNPNFLLLFSQKMALSLV